MRHISGQSVTSVASHTSWPSHTSVAKASHHEFYGHWSHDLDKALMGHQHDGIPLFLTTKVIEPLIVPGHLVYGLLVP